MSHISYILSNLPVKVTCYLSQFFAISRFFTATQDTFSLVNLQVIVFLCLFESNDIALVESCILHLRLLPPNHATIITPYFNWYQP